MAEWLNRRLTHSTAPGPAPRALPADGEGARPQGAGTVGDDRAGRGASRLSLRGLARVVVAVLVVGHQPTLGLVASTLLTGGPLPWTVKKAAVWWLRHRPRVDDGEVVLQAMQAPDCL